MNRSNRISALFITISMMLSSCAGETVLNESKGLLAEGQVEAGLSKLHNALEKDPQNIPLRNYYYHQRELQLNRLLIQADVARQQDQLDDAERLYHQVQDIDLSNERAVTGLQNIALERRHRQQVKEAETLFNKGDVAGATSMVQTVLLENPQQKYALLLKRRITEKNDKTDPMARLKSAKSKPISIEFRDISLKSVFELLSRNAGINFVFDKDVRSDNRTTVFFKDGMVEDVIRLILATNQLDQKVLSDNTILIYPNTPAKQKEYQELLTKSFYIGNGDAKALANTIKTIVKPKDMVVDEKLNYIVIRDTLEAVALASRLIANLDVPDPEVMLDLEVLEVSTNRLKAIGIQYPDQLSASVIGVDNTAGMLQLNEAKHFNSGLVRLNITNPTLALSLKKVDSDTNLLANPRIRVKNRDKAKVHVGERVPVITTTSTANVGVSESVNYLDVGLKLEVEPTIMLNDAVSMKIGLEVSNILETITRSSGLQAYRLGTRNTTTSLMLKDGETQVLAGLIQDDDRKSANKVPGLGDLPLIGRLFSNHNDNNTKTEIVLLITPHIVRNVVRPEAQDTEFLSGTDNSTGAAPMQFRPADQPAAAVLTPTSNPTAEAGDNHNRAYGLAPATLPSAPETTDSSQRLFASPTSILVPTPASPSP